VLLICSTFFFHFQNCCVQFCISALHFAFDPRSSALELKIGALDPTALAENMLLLFSSILMAFCVFFP
jgi:hypothetical protein